MKNETQYRNLHSFSLKMGSRRLFRSVVIVSQILANVVEFQVLWPTLCLIPKVGQLQLLPEPL